MDGKPVKAYLSQHDVWTVSINALVLVQLPHYAPFIPLRAHDHQDGMGVPSRIGRLLATTLTLKLCAWHLCRQSHFAVDTKTTCTHSFQPNLHVRSTNIIKKLYTYQELTVNLILGGDPVLNLLDPRQAPSESGYALLLLH